MVFKLGQQLATVDGPESATAEAEHPNINSRLDQMLKRSHRLGVERIGNIGNERAKIS